MGVAGFDSLPGYLPNGKKIKKPKRAERRSKMNELERAALNEIMRTVTYIAEKVDEIDAKISSSDSQVPEHREK